MILIAENTSFLEGSWDKVGKYYKGSNNIKQILNDSLAICLQEYRSSGSRPTQTPSHNSIRGWKYITAAIAWHLLIGFQTEIICG